MDIKDKNYLNNLCIYELRAVAYKIGLKNASTYKKKDLIEEIINFTPNKKISNRGRPSYYKNLNINENVNQKELENFYIEYLKKVTKSFIAFISNSINFGSSNKYKNFIDFVKKLEN